MELTKEQENEMYKMILSDIESEKETFCCDSIVEMSRKSTLIDQPIGYVQAKYYLEKLYTFKTTNIEFSWFNNKQERIDALKKCIEQTKCD